MQDCTYICRVHAASYWLPRAVSAKTTCQADPISKHAAHDGLSGRSEKVKRPLHSSCHHWCSLCSRFGGGGSGIFTALRSVAAAIVFHFLCDGSPRKQPLQCNVKLILCKIFRYYLSPRLRFAGFAKQCANQEYHSARNLLRRF